MVMVGQWPLDLRATVVVTGCVFTPRELLLQEHNRGGTQQAVGKVLWVVMRDQRLCRWPSWAGPVGGLGRVDGDVRPYRRESPSAQMVVWNDMVQLDAMSRGHDHRADAAHARGLDDAGRAAF